MLVGVVGSQTEVEMLGDAEGKVHTGVWVGVLVDAVDVGFGVCPGIFANVVVLCYLMEAEMLFGILVEVHSWV